MTNSQMKIYGDLNVSTISASDIPNDIFFPEELNQYLRGQIQFLTHANGMLQKTINEKEMKIDNNLKRITEYETNVTSDNPSYLLSQKIVELNKKLKNKNADTELLKSKYNTLHQKLKILESAKLKDELKSKESERNQSVYDELKRLQDKLTTTTNKLFDIKNTNFQLKNELKAANRILQQEIGDSFTSIQNLLNSQSNWRGRAQQILTLRQKNTELHDKLISENYKEPTGNLNKLNDNRKQIIEQLQLEINYKKQELEETRKKLTGSRARVKILENECVSLKCKINTITEKNDNDNEIIKMLSSQVTSMEEAQIDIKKEKHNSLQKLEIEIKNLKIEIDKQKYMQENLKKCLTEKENKISALENDLTKAKFLAVEERPHTPLSDEVCQNMEEDNRTIQNLNCQILKLSQFIATLNDRLNEERNAHSVTRDKYTEAVQKAAQLEHKLSRVEIENSIYSSQSLNRTYSKSTGVETAKASNLSLENLQNRVELADEHIASLKTKLAILKKEKELDYKKFVSFIEEFTCLFGQKEREQQVNKTT